MELGRWTGLAVSLFLAAFLAAWILDASLPASHNLTDPQLWLLAASLGAGGLALAATRSDAERRTVLLGGLAGMLLTALVVAALYGFLGSVGYGGPTVHVERSSQQPVATVDPQQAYEEVPALAEALDELVTSNQTSVLVTRDQETFDRIERFLVEATGDYVDPFTWRGETVRVSAIIG